MFLVNVHCKTTLITANQDLYEGRGYLYEPALFLFPV